MWRLRAFEITKAGTGKKVIKGRICPECLRDLDQEYIEEGDHRFLLKRIDCYGRRV